VHALVVSDSEETAAREIKFFFPEFDIEKWRKDFAQFFVADKIKYNPGTCQHVPAT
jgi:hypothetical protein